MRPLPAFYDRSKFAQNVIVEFRRTKLYQEINEVVTFNFTFQENDLDPTNGICILQLLVGIDTTLFAVSFIFTNNFFV